MITRVLLVSSIALASLAGCMSSSPAEPGESDVEVTNESNDEIVKAANDLSPAEEKLVLKLVDDICGDTWCGGDYNFFFSKMKCSFSARTCTITMKLMERPDDVHATREFWRSCKMRDIAGFTSMVHTSANGYQSLEPAFYDKVNACVNKLEKTIPPR